MYLLYDQQMRHLKKLHVVVTLVVKNTYFEEHPLTAASDFLKQLQDTGEQLPLY